MKVSRPLTGLTIGCVMSLATAVLGGQANDPAADPAIPTPLEEALIEYACGPLHPAGALESDAYLDCRKNQLLYLRTEFGRDLRRLSNTERKTLDTTCGGLRMSRGQDAYLSCLQAQLATLPGHGKKVASQAIGAAAPAAAPAATPLVSPAPAASSPISPLWVGAVFAALIAGAAGAREMKRRGPPSAGACRVCGAAVAARGDLCPPCRRDAAETLRRATTERVDQARAGEDAVRRLAAREREQQQRERDERARRQELEAAQAAEARQQEEEAQRRRDEEARRQRQTDAAAAVDEFDPH